MKETLQRSCQLFWASLVCIAIILGTPSPHAIAQPVPTPTASPSPVPKLRETTSLVSGRDQLTVASFNVENLDPSDGDRFTQLAKIIITNLKQPDILSLIEVQDNNGADDTGVTEANQTYEKLIAQIEAAGGSKYAFTDIAPQNNQDGGEPGGNIRNGFLYLPKRVSLVQNPKGSANEAIAVVKTGAGAELSLNPGRIDPTNPAFNDDPASSGKEGSRKPLVAEFQFNNQKIFIIANHFVSKRGGTAADTRRIEQAKVVNSFVKKLLAAEPTANIIVQGDLNDGLSSQPLKTLAGQELKNLAFTLPSDDRYSYVFRGKPELIDHILVSKTLAPQAQLDIVHVNAGFTNQASDHDPVLAQYQIAVSGSGQPTPTPSGLSTINRWV